MTPHNLEFARGYLMLRMLDDALLELDGLQGDDRLEPEAVELRIAVLMERKEWRDALKILLPQARAEDCQDGVFINTAICLHKLGNTPEAKRTHLRCSRAMQNQAIFHYNLACYEAQLGEPEAAMRSLRRTFKLDPLYRHVATEDPDLVPIRNSLEDLLQAV